MLIGNGLNLTMSSHSISWFNLLSDLAKNRKLVSNKKMPTSLEFERLMNLHMQKNYLKNKVEAYSRAKASIAKSIQKISVLPLSAIHHKIRSLHIDNILTTKYDKLLESTFGLSSIRSLCDGSIFCMLGPTDIVSGTKFYHIYGLVTKPSTMCLGSIHYLRIVKIFRMILIARREAQENK